LFIIAYKQREMKHGSLFSGIGGFDLAAEWVGWENIFHCEWNKFGQRVLKHYWPNAVSYEDITKTDFSIHRGQIDILTGGFPCQPYSSAGKRLGKEDDRHLWPEMLRAIREIQPSYIVGENVFGLVNWSEGLVFDEVQTDLENEGYEVQPVILPACAVNAPHRRDRIWFVAYSDECAKRSSRQSGETKSKRSKNNDEQSSRGKQTQQYIGCSDVHGVDTYADCQRLERNGEERENTKRENPERYVGQSVRTWDGWPTQSPICSGNDGFSSRLDGITFPKWRQESIKAYGNAVVPQVVYQIFKAIESHEKPFK